MYLLPGVLSAWIISICSMTGQKLSTYFKESKFSPGFYQALFMTFQESLPVISGTVSL